MSKLIAIIVVIVLVMVGIFYSLGVQKDLGAMDISVDVLMDEEGWWHITYVNATFREVNKLSVPKGNEIVTPGVVATVIYDSKLIGYYTSVTLDPTVPRNSTKTYNLSIGLFNKPVEGDTVNVSVRLIGFVGEDLESYKFPFKVEYK